eukprot:gene4339-5430_t
MNKFLFNFLILCLIYTQAIQATTYVLMVPFSKPDCSGEQYGVGYGWQAGVCIGFKSNNYYVGFGGHNNSSVIITSVPDSENCGSSGGVSRSYAVGGCYQVTYADYDSYVSSNYVQIQVVEDPSIPTYGLRNSIYAANDNECQGDVQMYYYYTNGTVFKDMFDTYTFYCQNSSPMEQVCQNGCFSNTWWQAVTYVLMVPYNKPDCSGDQYGVGYGWQVGVCFGFKSNNYFVGFGGHDNSSVIITSVPDSENCGSKGGVSRSYAVGGCYQVTYADYGSYVSTNYVQIQVVEDPIIPVYGFKNAVYGGNDHDCQGDVQMYYYYTNGTVFKDMFDTYTFYCQDSNPMEQVPYNSSDCSGDQYGVGYGWQVGVCVGFKSNNFYVGFGGHENSTAIITSVPDTQNCGSKTGAVSRTFQVGGCYQVNYADYGNYVSYNWVQVQVVEDPIIPKYGLKNSIFSADDRHCQGEVEMYYYYTNGTIFNTEFNTYQFMCEGGTPFEQVCQGSDCFQVQKKSNCGRSFFHLFQNYNTVTC